jgi:CRP/FNR family transcriptional regulator, cyclic AMP receptor protein
MYRPGPEKAADKPVKDGVLNAAGCIAYGLHSFPPWEATRAGRASQLSGGEIFRNLSPIAMCDFESIAECRGCRRNEVLIKEGEEPINTLLLLEGTAKLSINSFNGRRLILGIAGPGEILGLSSAISGDAFEVTGEAQFPCVIASIERTNFLNFLQMHPVVCHNVARQLSLGYKRVHQQLRTLALTRTAPAKLARLLLGWCPKAEHSGIGARVQCSFTHGEIGEHIGLSRETVTRLMTDFRGRGLVDQRGSILTISSRDALEVHAGGNSKQVPNMPAT